MTKYSHKKRDPKSGSVLPHPFAKYAINKYCLTWHYRLVAKIGILYLGHGVFSNVVNLLYIVMHVTGFVVDIWNMGGQQFLELNKLKVIISFWTKWPPNLWWVICPYLNNDKSYHLCCSDYGLCMVNNVQLMLKDRYLIMWSDTSSKSNTVKSCIDLMYLVYTMCPCSCSML